MVFLTCAVLLVVGAEWPRLSERFGGGDARPARKRRRRGRKPELTLVPDEDDRQDFAQSVERDLANLPVIDTPDERSRR